MTFQQLNYLVEISKCGSINKAAQKLFLSQSGISIAIKELEEELHITFFIRTNKGVTFTPEGREFLSHAVSLLDSKKRLEMLYSKNESRAASVYFSIASQRYPFTQDAFMKLVNRNADKSYRLQLNETGIEDVIEVVSSHNADIGVISVNELTGRIINKLLESREVEFFPLYTVKSCVYVDKNHPLAVKKTVTEEELSGYPYITFDQSQGVAIDFSEECQLFRDKAPEQRIVINTRESALDLIVNSRAITTGSGLLVKGISPDGVISIPIKGQPDINIGYLLSSESKPDGLVNEFKEILCESIRSSIEYTGSLCSPE